MSIVQYVRGVAGALAGAAAKILKAREFIFFDPDDFDVDDVPDVRIDGTRSDPAIATGYSRVRARAGAGGNVPETRTLTGDGDVLIEGDSNPHDLSADRTFSTSATPNSTPAKIAKRDDNARIGCAGVTCGAAQTWIHSHAQHASAGGVADTWRGQAAATGAFSGGALDFRGGARGDSDHWEGGVRIGLGEEDDNTSQSAFCSFYNTNPAVSFGQICSGAGHMLISSTSIMELHSGDDILVVAVGALSYSLGTKPTITGSRGGNVALANLLTALAAYGLITDSTS
jgi:hypothetical protein